jgi:hypothetical protein
MSTIPAPEPVYVDHVLAYNVGDPIEAEVYERHRTKQPEAPEQPELSEEDRAAAFRAELGLPPEEAEEKPKRRK